MAMVKLTHMSGTRHAKTRRSSTMMCVSNRYDCDEKLMSKKATSR